jgi:hypothetical protein
MFLVYYVVGPIFWCLFSESFGCKHVMLSALFFCTTLTLVSFPEQTAFANMTLTVNDQVSAL